MKKLMSGNYRVGSLFSSLVISLSLTACGGGSGGSGNTNLTDETPYPTAVSASDMRNYDMLARDGVSAPQVSFLNNQLQITQSVPDLNADEQYQIYLNLDNDAGTGYNFGYLGWDETGADYLVENGHLFESLSNDSSWNWNTKVGKITASRTSDTVSVSIPRDLLKFLNPQIRVGFMVRNADWSIRTMFPQANLMELYSLDINPPVDKEAPIITLNGAETITLTINDAYTEAGATAMDNVDGDLSTAIEISSNIDTSVAGTYQVVYSVSDAAGNLATAIRTVIVSPQPASGIQVDGNDDDWSDIAVTVETSTGSIKVTDTPDTLFVLIKPAAMDINTQIFLDTDNDASTGYLFTGYIWNNAGVDYMVENGHLDRARGDGGWSWEYDVNEINFVKTDSLIEVAIPKFALANLADSINIGYVNRDANWHMTSVLPEYGLVNTPLNYPPSGATNGCTIQGSFVKTVASQQECDALIALYNATSESWPASSKWNTATDPCGWSHVTCDAEGISKLDFGATSIRPGVHLIGSIPAEIGDLKNLVSLRLDYRTLDGIPAEIGQLSKLQELSIVALFANTGIEGPLPLTSEIGNLLNLTSLTLSNTQLTSLPEEIGKLVNLEYLSLAGNQLTDFPAQFFNLVNLRNLELDQNPLTSLPAEIGKLVNLENLSLSTAGLTKIPVELGNLVNLRLLILSDNRLSTLPAEIGRLVNLETLNLSQNGLTVLPPEIGNLVSLTQLSAMNGNLTTLPQEFGNLRKLQNLYLQFNQLTSLPSTIGQLENLVTANFSVNDLTGLPAEIGNLTKLHNLYLHQNQLNTLPSEIGKLTNLTSLNLSRNQLTDLPEEIGNLVDLSVLNLGGNQFTSLPLGITNLVKLGELDLSNNQLSSLPPEIGNLVNLSMLYLNDNQFSAYPYQLIPLNRLSTLNLRNNQLTSLSGAMERLENIGSLDLRGNQLSGDITIPFTSLMDTIWRLYISDGAGGNNCLSVTDSALKQWLDQRDSNWAECK